MTQNTIGVEIQGASGPIAVTLVGEASVQQVREYFTFTEDGHAVSVKHDGERYQTTAPTKGAGHGA